MCSNEWRTAKIVGNAQAIAISREIDEFIATEDFPANDKRSTDAGDSLVGGIMDKPEQRSSIRKVHRRIPFASNHDDNSEASQIISDNKAQPAACSSSDSIQTENPPEVIRNERKEKENISPVVSQGSLTCERRSPGALGEKSVETTETNTESVPEDSGIAELSVLSSPSSSSTPASHSSKRKSSISDKGVDGNPSLLNNYEGSLPPDWLLDQLKATRDGRFILSFYKTNNYLPDAERKQLVKIIISNELENDASKIIAPERFTDIAKVICRCFPSEFEGTYYVPYTQSSKGKKRPARGKLYDKFIYFRRIFTGRGLIVGKKHINANSSDNDDDNDGETEDLPKEVNDALSWLKSNAGPLTDAIKNIQLTSKVRQRIFMKSKEDIYGYLKQYPALTNEDGFMLIDKDFEGICHHQNTLFSKWNETFVDRIIVHAQRKAVFQTDFAGLLVSAKIILKIDITDDKIKDANTKLITSLFLLPILLPSFFATKKWKPSKAEAKNGFLIWTETLDEAKKNAAERNSKLAEHGFTPQPLPAVIGAMPNCMYVVLLNDVVYDCKAPLKIIDVCFKLCTFLETGYPPDSRMAWTFLKKFVYGMESDCELQYPSLGTLAKSLELM